VNVWLVNQYAYTPREHAGSRHFAFARELIRRGHDVRVISSSFYHKGRRQLYADPHSPVKAGSVDGVPYVWVRTPAYGGNLARLWNMLVFSARLLSGWSRALLPRPDVIVATTPSPLAAMGALLLARRYACHHVLEVVDIWPDTLRDVSGASRWHPFYLVLGFLERWLYRRTDAVLTHLPNAQAHFVSRGARAEKCHFLRSPVPFPEIPPYQAPPRESRFHFFHAGAMTASYALDQIVSAAEWLVRLDASAARRITIDFIGEGPVKTELVKRVSAAGFDEWIRFRDPVRKSDILNTLAGANAFLIVSKDLAVHEHGVSFNKIFDSMVVGRPIILANRARRTPIENAGVGLVVPPEKPEQLARAMLEVASWPPDECERIGRRAREYVLAHHSLAGWGSGFEELLGALQQPRGPIAASRAVAAGSPK
jgi:glycosyltransferase involved in cell wall biosynthesis